MFPPTCLKKDPLVNKYICALEIKILKKDELVTSVKIRYRIARECNVHRNGVTLVNICATGLPTYIIDEKVARKVQLLRSADNRIRRIIQDCAANMLDELVWRLKLSELVTVQLDENRDFAN
jgi:hypothetical protein